MGLGEGRGFAARGEPSESSEPRTSSRAFSKATTDERPHRGTVQPCSSACALCTSHTPKPAWLASVQSCSATRPLPRAKSAAPRELFSERSALGRCRSSQPRSSSRPFRLVCTWKSVWPSPQIVPPVIRNTSSEPSLNGAFSSTDLWERSRTLPVRMASDAKLVKSLSEIGWPPTAAELQRWRRGVTRQATRTARQAACIRSVRERCELRPRAVRAASPRAALAKSLSVLADSVWYYTAGSLNTNVSFSVAQRLATLAASVLLLVTIVPAKEQLGGGGEAELLGERLSLSVHERRFSSRESRLDQ